MDSAGRAAVGESGLWTVVDVAEYLRVSRSWVYQRVESGTLPYLRVGSLVRFEPEAIKAYARGGGGTTAPATPVPNGPKR